MKISPIDIRQHTFEKGFRGYDIDEVNAFLNSLSQEWERVMNDNKLLKMQLEIAEKELNKLRDVEMTLFRTLKTAEDTSNQIAEQANRAAEKYIQESRLKTDETIVDTRRKASMIIQDAENEAKYIREEIINELKNQERDFRAMEKYRDNLVVQLKSLANNTSEAVERFEKKFSKDPSFEQRMEEIKSQDSEAEISPFKEQEQAENSTLEKETDSPEEPTSPAHEAENTQHEESSDSATTYSVKANYIHEEYVIMAQGTEDTEPVIASPTPDVAPATDAASEALAEVEKMAEARQQALELDVSESTPPPAVTHSEKKPEGQGSFFDQIG